jgi:hypothetical protein
MLYDGPFYIPYTGASYFSPATTRNIVVSFPFAITFGNYAGQGGNFSVLILALFPLISFLPKSIFQQNSTLKMLTTAGILNVSLFLLFQPGAFATRYFLGFIFMLLPILAISIDNILQIQGISKLFKSSIPLFTSTVLIVTLLSYREGNLYAVSSRLQYLAGMISPCEYGSSQSAYCEVYTAVNQQADEGSRVFLATFPRYWLRPDLIQCSNVGGEIWYTDDLNWENIYSHGFTYLIADKAYGFTIDGLNLDHLPQWVQLELLARKKGVVGYRISYLSPPQSPMMSCTLDERGVWTIQSE